MGTTLDKLLRIQGTQEQQRMHLQQPPPAGTAAEQSPSVQHGRKLSEAERASWSAAYRLYEKYSPLLQEAARREDDGETACALFSEVAAALPEIYGGSVSGAALAPMLSELLDCAYRAEKEKQACKRG